MMSPLLVFLVSLSFASAGFFDDVSGASSDMGDFFSKNFQGVKDLFASSQGDLDKNVNRVKDLLTSVKEKAKMLEPLASDSQKQTLGKIDQFLSQVTSFQQQAVQGGQQKFEENKNRWQQMVTAIFEKGGLTDLMKLLTKSSYHTSFAAAIAVPIIMALVH